MDEPLPAGVGLTALAVADARARETARADRLIEDPFAHFFIDAAGAAFAADHGGAGIDIRAMRAEYLAVRTRYFDDALLAATADGCRQLVLLAAGLDTRVFRLGLRPCHTRVVGKPGRLRAAPARDRGPERLAPAVDLAARHCLEAGPSPAIATKIALCLHVPVVQWRAARPSVPGSMQWRRWAFQRRNIVVCAGLGLLAWQSFAALPRVAAEVPGSSAESAVPVTSSGRFAGTVAPQSSTWFHSHHEPPASKSTGTSRK